MNFYKTIILCIVILCCFCCSSKNNKGNINLNKDSLLISDFEIRAKIFSPKSIGIYNSIDDTLDKIAAKLNDRLLNSKDSARIISCVYIILLKQCLFEFHNSNITYDMLTRYGLPANKGLGTKRIVDIYIKYNHLDSEYLYRRYSGGQSSFSSVLVYDNVLERGNLLKNNLIKALIVQIEGEQKRIEAVGK